MRRKGRPPQVLPHPYHCTPDTLRAHLDHLGVETGRLSNQYLKIWLPSVGNRPVPSLALQATGAMVVPEGAVYLQAWQVAGLALPIGPALQILLALRLEGIRARTITADLRAWRVAALLAMSSVAGGPVLPVLLREDFDVRPSFWTVGEGGILQPGWGAYAYAYDTTTGL